MSTEQDTQELLIDSERETQVLHSEPETLTDIKIDLNSEQETRETETGHINPERETLAEETKTDHAECLENTQYDTKICEKSCNQTMGELPDQSETPMDIDECGLWPDKIIREEKRLIENSADNHDNKKILTQQEYIDMFLEDCGKAI